MLNTIGKCLRLTTFGESHGPAIGGVIDGCPAGVVINMEDISQQLKRRRTGEQFYSSKRHEKDEVEFLSGISKGITIGTPLAFIIRNLDAKPADYIKLQNVYRPSHADYSWEQKFDLPLGSGGGRSSARALVPCVVAGSIAASILSSTPIKIIAWVSQIGPYGIHLPDGPFPQADINSNSLRCPDKKAAKNMLAWLEELKHKGDTTGGIITCSVTGCHAGIGEPFFGKLHAELAHAMMCINSVKGFEYGSGFCAAAMKGSEYNDALVVKNGCVHTATNHDGGINGGISNGEDIIFRVAFKPVSSLGMEQNTLNKDKKPIKIKIHGRHDTCVVPRAVPIVEAFAYLVIADHFLMQKIRKNP